MSKSAAVKGDEAFRFATRGMWLGARLKAFNNHDMAAKAARSHFLPRRCENNNASAEGGALMFLRE
jgi:hypothetical protein